MAVVKQSNLTLPPSTLLVTLLPLAAILVSGALMQLGFPATDYGPPQLAAADKAALVHLEAAARMKMLATWALLTAMSLGCIGYFAFSLTRFDGRTRGLLIGFYILCSLFGTAFTLAGAGGSGERVLGETFLCSSLRLVHEQALPARPPAELAPKAPPAYRCPDPADPNAAPAERIGREVRIVTCPPQACEAILPGYLLLRRMNLFQRLLIPWAATTLILGALSCLATGSPGRRRPVADREQVARLNTYLYLTAALFVCGLLFLSALLQWPGYAFEGKAAEAYRAHASAFVLYWGVCYSIIIAAYYLPVAILLARRSGNDLAGRSGQPGEGAGVPGAPGPFEVLKIAAGIFAPAIAGLLGDIVQL